MFRSSTSLVHRSRVRKGRTWPFEWPFFTPLRLAGLLPFLRALRATAAGWRRDRDGELDTVRLAAAMRSRARTSSGFVIECQPATPRRLAIDARFLRDSAFRASDVMIYVAPTKVKSRPP